jgi:hypothetical protein
LRVLGIVNKEQVAAESGYHGPTKLHYTLTSCFNAIYTVLSLQSLILEFARLNDNYPWSGFPGKTPRLLNYIKFLNIKSNKRIILLHEFL